MTSFFIETLGCKINQYESQALREAWLAQGLAEASIRAEARVVVVSTCAVTANAVADSRRLVRAVHRDNPKARIVVTGCAAQLPQPAAELAQLPGVDRVVPQAAKDSLKAWPVAEAPTPEPEPAGPATAGRRAYPDLSITDFPRARPTLKVQDGCSHGCSYCIVPTTRGASVSREPAQVLAEAAVLIKAGFRELVVSGINLRHYGRDLTPAMDFWDLLAKLDRLVHDAHPEARLRLSSIDPGQIAGKSVGQAGAKALDTLAGSARLCPHLHLSLQSGSAGVLKRMNRGHYAPQDVARFVADLRLAWPAFAQGGLGADLLVGFPGETEEEFAQTESLLRELPMTYGHVFPYSARPGTRAAAMDAQVPDEVKRARAARLRDLLQAREEAFARSLAEAGASLEVAIESLDESPLGEGCVSHGKGVSGPYVECLFLASPGRGLKSVVRAQAAGTIGPRLLVRPA